MGQQQGTELGAAFLRRFVEGRESPLVGGVHTSVVLDEQGGDVHVLDGEVKRGEKRAGIETDENQKRIRAVW